MKGYRTYICVALAAAAYALNLTGFIPDDQLDKILEGLGIGVAWFLRSAMK